MKTKLYANMQRMTTVFCIGILCMTASMVALRLTVFSDMAAAPEAANGNVVSSEEDGYSIESKVYFSSATGKGDIFIKNLGEENLIRVQVKLEKNGELIMATGLINPGSSQPSIRMNPSGQKLAEGVYPCVAEVASYKPDDVRSAIKTADVELTVYIGQRPEKESSKDKK